MGRQRPQPYDPRSIPSTARHLASLGYHVVPLVPGNKSPLHPSWANLRLTPDDAEREFHPDTDSNLGVLLGTEIAPSTYLHALDIDLEDDLLISRVRLALSHERIPAKRGAKGITFFARSAKPFSGKKLARKDAVGKRIMTLELLGRGNQTVVPPSLHPSGATYEWVGLSLADVAVADLPELDDAAWAEIDWAVRDPEHKVFLLNSMTPSGNGVAGTVHDSVLTATAALVAKGWEADLIWRRVARATSRSDEMAGLSRERPGWEAVVRKMIMDAQDKGFERVVKARPEFAAAQWLVQDWRGKNVYNRDNMIMAYRNGYYECLDRDMVVHTFAREYEQGKGSFVATHWKIMADTALALAERFPVSLAKRRVCLLNGTFDMETRRLSPWSPEDFLLSQLPFTYDATATCPTYDAVLERVFLDPVLDSDQERQDRNRRLSMQCYEEYLALTLFEDLTFQKFLVILGEPDTGKSTLIKIVEMLHDPRAVSHVGIRDLDDERYKVALVGKLVNISNEVQATTYAADDILKAVTAGDTLEFRNLFQRTFSHKASARLIMVCNELFRIHDTSGAVERRMLVLNCNNKLAEGEKDPRIEDRLRSELPGIFNRMVEAWARLRARDRFVAPELHSESVSRFTEQNNVVIQWIKARTHQGAKLTDPGYKLPDRLQPTTNEELFADFNWWCKENNYKGMTPTSWGMRLNQARLPGLNLKTESKWIAGRVRHVRALNLLKGGLL